MHSAGPANRRASRWHRRSTRPLALRLLAPRCLAVCPGVRRRGSDDRGRASRHSERRDDHVPGGRRRPISIARKAYNGICTALVTEDGAAVPAGARATCAPVRRSRSRRRLCPSERVTRTSISTQACRSSSAEWSRRSRIPRVQQQFGMRVGMPNAGQVNALETLNIRGERSVTCKGELRSTHPSERPAAGRRARQCARSFASSRTRSSAPRSSTRSTARNPDLKTMPMYCVVFSLKNWYDAKDMRATGGNDVNFAMDAPKVRFARRRRPARERRDHLRRRHGARRRACGATARASRDGSARRQLQDGRVGRPGLQSLRHRARAARHEQRLGRLGRGEPRAVLDLRAELGIVQRPRLAQQRRQPADHQGHPDGRRHRLFKRAGDRAGIHCRTVEDAVRCSTRSKAIESRRHVHRDPEGADSQKSPTRASSSATRRRAAKPLAGACASASCASSW